MLHLQVYQGINQSSKAKRFIMGKKNLITSVLKGQSCLIIVGRIKRIFQRKNLQNS